MKIRSRIIILFISSAFLSVFVFFLSIPLLNRLYTAVSEEEKFTPHKLERLVLDIQEAAISAAESGENGTAAEQAARLAPNMLPGIPGVAVQIIDGDGKVLETAAGDETVKTLQDIGLQKEIYTLEELTLLTVRSGFGWPKSAVIYAAPLPPEQSGGLVLGLATQEHVPEFQMTVSENGSGILLVLFLGAAGSVIVVTFIVILVGTRSLLRRFNRLHEGLRAVMAGDFSCRLEVRARDELGFISRSFNTMLEKLAEQQKLREEAEGERQRMIAGLSHDLRTPLSSILGYAENIRDNPEEKPSDIREQSEIIREKAEYMALLLEELLDYSASREFQTADATREDVVKFDVFELLRTTVISIIPQIKQKQISLDINIPEGEKMITGQRKGLTRVLENVLINAVNYCDRAGTITVSAETADDMSYPEQQGISIRVSNTGEKIAEENRARIFDTFYRGEASRHGTGMGLGLSIARNIVLQHGGKIYLDADQEDTTIVISL